MPGARKSQAVTRRFKSFNTNVFRSRLKRMCARPPLNFARRGAFPIRLIEIGFGRDERNRIRLWMEDSCRAQI